MFLTNTSPVTWVAHRTRNSVKCSLARIMVSCFNDLRTLRGIGLYTTFKLCTRSYMSFVSTIFLQSLEFDQCSLYSEHLFSYLQNIFFFSLPQLCFELFFKRHKWRLSSKSFCMNENVCIHLYRHRHYFIILMMHFNISLMQIYYLNSGWSLFFSW